MSGATATLAERLAVLRQEDPDAARLVGPWLETGSDREVYRVCPIRWGADRGLDGDAAAAVLLRATSAGLLRISWDLNCPGCGTIINSVERLGDVDNHFECDVCDKSRDLALDDWIMVTFTVRPDVRALPFHDPASLALRERFIQCDMGRGVVMVNGERVEDHYDRRLAGIELLEPGAKTTFHLDAVEGLFLMSPNGARPIVASPATAGTTPFELDLAIGADRVLAGLPAQVPVGPVTVRVRNDSAFAQRVIVFQSECYLRFGPPAGYNAARLIHHPVYRALFPPHLACCGGLQIRSVSILFSDLVESTAMYQELGDLRAYGKVREHFAAVAPVIDRHRGLWVKDIGDAVMASFTSAADAVAAALEMVRVVREQAHLDLKIGINTGACIGVTYRGHFDWFGSTVNLAARIQSLAGPGEVCVSSATYERAGDSVQGLPASEVQTAVRGIDEPVVAYRLRADLS
jgi:class 3 adenylate cyclase